MGFKKTKETWQKRPSIKRKKSNNKDIKTKYKQKKKMNNNKKSKPIKTIKRLWEKRKKTNKIIIIYKNICE